MKIKSTPFIIYISLFLFSCDTQMKISDDGYWAQFNIIGKHELINNDSVIICNPENIGNKKTHLPVSLVVEELNFIKLDDSNEKAFINVRFPHIYFSDTYFATMYGGAFPLKLFNQNGEYVRDIGKKGQGPGEYNVIIDIYLDEKCDKIYLLPVSATHILVYDFNGNYIFSIPLADKIMYGNAIKVNTLRQELLITNPPFPFTEYCIWIQDFQGNIIQGVKTSDYLGNIDFSSEATLTFFRSDNIVYFNAPHNNHKELLYHYNIEQNRLIPQFKVDTNNDKYQSIMINEFPSLYIVESARSTGIQDDLAATDKFIIDKNSLRGFQLEGFELYPFLHYDEYSILNRMKGSYFSILDFGSEIKRKIEQSNTNTLTKSEKEIMHRILNLIDDNDNTDDCCILFYGKIKHD